MIFSTKQYNFQSVSGLCDIYAQCIAPNDESKIKGVVQISHGMAEHSTRYIRFAKELCKAGYVVFLNDHVGHGLSVTDKKMLGYFGEKGEEAFIDDMKILTDIAKNEYPDLPFFVLGHGMGSLIARKYTAKYKSFIDGVVYSATSGRNPMLGFGLFLANTMIKLKGDRYCSAFLDSMAFGSYNKKTEKRTKCDWATRDEAEVDKYIADELCGYKYTVSGMKALFMTLKEVSSPDWYSRIPKDLPIFLVAGTMDPVGDYGKGVNQVYERLKQTGHHNISRKMYEGARHEILNETNRDEVFADIIEWLDTQVKNKSE